MIRRSGKDGKAQGASIRLTGLSKHYGSVAAVEDVELSVAPGEFVTFLGPSGSGKTTTLSMIAGFTIPTRGDILLNGRSIVKVPVHKRDVGMVFQSYALFPHMDVYGNVAFPLEMRRLPKAEIRERVSRALQLVRLEGYERRRPRQLSGGQQQRVALARVLVFEPSVLLLDEPLGALDAKLRDEMKVELKQLHSKIGATILFVTHDQEEALTLSDRIAVFDDGRLAQVGTPDQLYREPANRFVADFIGETNLLTGRVAEVACGTCRLLLPGGLEVRASLRRDFPVPRSHATFTLRLERIRLGEAAEQMPNRYRGRVEEFLYVGNSTKYIVRLADGLQITVKEPEQAQFQPLRPGSEVTVGWGESDMLLVEADRVPERE